MTDYDPCWPPSRKVLALIALFIIVLVPTSVLLQEVVFP